MENKQIIYDYAMKMVGLPYKWGGANPLTGMDCSGLVIELATAIGLSPLHDMTAQQLYEYYMHHGKIADPDFGVIAFFGRSLAHISHVGFCLSKELMIEAASGNQYTTSLEAARQQGAFIKIRPLRHRQDLVALVLPSWPCFQSTIN